MLWEGPKLIYLGISHVKVEFIPILKICTFPILESVQYNFVQKIRQHMSKECILYHVNGDNYAANFSENTAQNRPMK